MVFREVSQERWTYTCSEEDSFKEIPWQRMRSYLNSTLEKESLKKLKVPYTVQALWQETAETIAIDQALGLCNKSSVLFSFYSFIRR